MTAITFRTNDPAKWGTGAGANLTPTQVDTNFWNLKQAVEALEASPPEAISVDEIIQTGNSITFHLTDGSTQGPFTLPAAQITFRGEWVAATAYAVGDIISANANLYIVLTAHTSAATFDAGANNGSGADYYDLMLNVSTAIPTGGTVGQVLTKLSGTNYDVGWVDAAASGGSGSGGGGGGAPIYAMIGLINYTQITTPGTTNYIAWTKEYADAAGLHAANATDIIVPAGASLVRVGGMIWGGNMTAGKTLYAWVDTSNIDVYELAPYVQGIADPSGYVYLNFVSGPIPVSAGDEFRVAVFSDSSTLRIYDGSSHFWLEVIA